MKATNKFIIILSSVLLAFFLAGLFYFVYYPDEIDLYSISIIQLALFSVATCSVILFSVWLAYGKSRGAARNATKIVLLSETNSHKEEFTLLNRTSALIGKRDSVYIRSEIDLAVDGYAVINCVDDYWYVERVFDERSVGLKRAGEQFVYRLRTGISYKLQINDIIYIGNERLLVL